MTRIRSRSSSRVRDVRGAGGPRLPGLGTGRGPGLPIPVRAGGGIVGVLVIVAVIVISQLGDGDATPAADTGGPAACETELEQVVCGAVDDVVAYWDAQFPQSFQGADMAHLDGGRRDPQHGRDL